MRYIASSVHMWRLLIISLPCLEKESMRSTQRDVIKTLSRVGRTSTHTRACIVRAPAAETVARQLFSLRSMTWFQLNRSRVAPLSTSTGRDSAVFSLFFPVETQTKFRHQLRDHDSIQSAHSSQLSHATKRAKINILIYFKRLGGESPFIKIKLILDKCQTFSKFKQIFFVSRFSHRLHFNITGQIF